MSFQLNSGYRKKPRNLLNRVDLHRYPMECDKNCSFPEKVFEFFHRRFLKSFWGGLRDLSEKTFEFYSENISWIFMIKNQGSFKKIHEIFPKRNLHKKRSPEYSWADLWDFLEKISGNYHRRIELSSLEDLCNCLEKIFGVFLMRALHKIAGGCLSRLLVSLLRSFYEDLRDFPDKIILRRSLGFSWEYFWNLHKKIFLKKMANIFLKHLWDFPKKILRILLGRSVGSSWENLCDFSQKISWFFLRRSLGHSLKDLWDIPEKISEIFRRRSIYG